MPLEEFMKVGNTIFDKRMEIVRMIRDDADLGGKDPDHIVELCHEVLLSRFPSSLVSPYCYLQRYVLA